MKILKNEKVKLVLAIVALIGLICYYVFFYFSTCGIYKGMQLSDKFYLSDEISMKVPESLRDTIVSFSSVYIFENYAGNPVYVRLGVEKENNEIIYVVKDVKCFDKRYLNNSTAGFMQIKAGMDLKDIVGIVGMPQNLLGSGEPRAHFKDVFGKDYYICLVSQCENTEYFGEYGNSSSSSIFYVAYAPAIMPESSKGIAGVLPYLPIRSIMLYIIAGIMILFIFKQSGVLPAVNVKKVKRIFTCVLCAMLIVMVLFGTFCWIAKPYDTCGIKVGDQINVNSPADSLPTEFAESCISIPKRFFCFYNKFGNIVFVRHTSEGRVTEVKCITTFFTCNHPIAFQIIPAGIEISNVIQMIGMPIAALESGACDFQDSNGNLYRVYSRTLQPDTKRNTYIFSGYRNQETGKEFNPVNLLPYIRIAVTILISAIVFIHVCKVLKKHSRRKERQHENQETI